MYRMIVGLYPNAVDGENVMRELQAAGFSRNDLSLIRKEPERKRGEKEEKRALIDDLTSRGADHDDAEIYAEGIIRGQVLVTCKTETKDADKAAEIMSRHKAADIDKQAAEWRSAGWTPLYGRESRPPETRRETARTDIPRAETRGEIRRGEERPERAAGEEARYPVVEEELQVGIRKGTSGVRIYRHVTAKPVEEKVRLHGEQVRVERRPADRPLSAGDRDAFREETIELTETTEEPVVSKQQRVVEEVVVKKEQQDRDVTVRDTVRRSDVEVQRMAAGSTQARGEYDDDFRRDFETRYSGRGVTYDQYAPAYTFGTRYAGEQKYSDWNALEPVARRDWESSGSKTRWEEAKDAIRFGWDRARRRRI